MFNRESFSLFAVGNFEQPFWNYLFMRFSTFRSRELGRIVRVKTFWQQREESQVQIVVLNHNSLHNDFDLVPLDATLSADKPTSGKLFEQILQPRSVWELENLQAIRNMISKSMNLNANRSDEFVALKNEYFRNYVFD